MSNYYFENEPVRFCREDLDYVLIRAESERASDIFIRTGSEIITKIDGRYKRVTRRRLDTYEIGDMVTHVYGPNAKAQLTQGLPVDDSYEIRPDRFTRSRYRMNAVSCHVAGQQGIEITFRTISTVPPDAEELGIEPEILNNYAPRNGIVLITGPTGSGKSTTQASLIKRIAVNPDEHRRILLHESPIEYVFDSIPSVTSDIVQCRIPEDLKSFLEAVRTSLRRAPDIIGIGELRDYETISAAVEASMTGHLVMGTTHTTSVHNTVRRLIAAFPTSEKNGAAKDVIDSIRLIINQQLWPSVDGRRVALREYLVFTESIRDALLDVEPDQLASEVLELVRSQGRSLANAARIAYEENKITLETLNHIEHKAPKD